MKRIGSLLIILALVVAMVGCGSGFYGVAITSTAGGSVTSPWEGMFAYELGTVVNLTGEAHEGYRFVKWTGDTNTIANVESATTTITISDSCFITANFVAVYDLTIHSAAARNVIIPAEGAFTYDTGPVVEDESLARESYTPAPPSVSGWWNGLALPVMHKILVHEPDEALWQS